MNNTLGSQGGVFNVLNPGSIQFSGERKLKARDCIKAPEKTAALRCATVLRVKLSSSQGKMNILGAAKIGRTTLAHNGIIVGQLFHDVMGSSPTSNTMLPVENSGHDVLSLIELLMGNSTKFGGIALPDKIDWSTKLLGSQGKYDLVVHEPLIRIKGLALLIRINSLSFNSDQRGRTLLSDNKVFNRLKTLGFGGSKLHDVTLIKGISIPIPKSNIALRGAKIDMALRGAVTSEGRHSEVTRLTSSTLDKVPCRTTLCEPVKSEVRHSDLPCLVELSHACDNLPRCPDEFPNAFGNLLNRRQQPVGGMIPCHSLSTAKQEDGDGPPNQNDRWSENRVPTNSQGRKREVAAPHGADYNYYGN